MYTFLLRGALTVGALLYPLAALAAPGNIRDLEATYANGNVRVSWTAPTSGDAISSYRIYISHQSILDNNGLYDDIEKTSGPQTEFLITDLPPVSQIFIGVLAISDKGEESGFFTEEVSVILPMERQPSSSSISSAKTFATSSAASSSSTPVMTILPEKPEPSMQELLGAEAISATGVLLTFSQFVSIPKNEAAGTFTIRDGSGTLLPITRIIITGTVVTLVTVKQERATVYQIRVSSPSINPEKSLLLFTGHPTGSAPVSEPVKPPVVPPTPPTPTPPTPTKPPVLNNSGAGILLTTLLSGAFAGWKRMRRV